MNNVKPICLNSKGGRGGVDGLQPSVQDRVYSSEGVSTAITTSFMPSIAVNNVKSCAMRGRYCNDGTIKQQIEVNESNTANTITTVQKDSMIMENNNLRIRKLTPKECWRLMGFDDVDFDKATQVNSNAQLYKQAGNSIVVNVLENIFSQML